MLFSKKILINEVIQISSLDWLQDLFIRDTGCESGIQDKSVIVIDQAPYHIRCWILSIVISQLDERDQIIESMMCKIS